MKEKRIEINNIRKKYEIEELVIEHYHFSSQDRESIKTLLEALSPLLDIRANYKWHETMEKWLVFMTIGSAFDRFQRVYSDAGCLKETYILECIGLELLSAAFEVFGISLQNETDQWIEKMEFLGDAYPLELLPALHQYIYDEEEAQITYNEQLMLLPAKSVVFFLPMSQNPKEGNPCKVCNHCSNKACVFRREDEKTAGKRAVIMKNLQKGQKAYTYGMQRIFGSNNRE